MRKKYTMPAAAAVALHCEGMMAQSLKIGGASESDKVSSEGQVLSNDREGGYNSSLWGAMDE